MELFSIRIQRTFQLVSTRLQEEIAGIGKVTDREQTAYGDARLYL